MDPSTPELPPASPDGPQPAGRARLVLRFPRRLRLALVLLLLMLVALAAFELRSSRLQAWAFSEFGRRLTYETQPGSSPAIHFPGPGPYDQRMGYSRLPAFLDRLLPEGYVIEAQARCSEALLGLGRRGLFLPYCEKTRAGLRILDRDGAELFAATIPERVFASFEAMPPLAVQTLLFIENRELLAPGRPYRNPAVEWDRLARALLDKGLEVVGLERNVPGGSTLATQREKFRHSPEGRTQSAADKLRQMISASLRSYLGGAETLEARRALLLDYVNSIPLAAIPGHGEVIGLGDGLWAWYGADLERVNGLLREGPGRPGAETAERALAFKQVLSLFLAHRRPSFYLVSGRRSLRELTDAYLRLLADGGVISPALRNAALPLELQLNDRAPTARPVPLEDRKSAHAIRARLLPLLGLERVYDLDRLDLTVETTLDGAAQEQVSRLLRELRDPGRVEAAGLRAHRLLDRGNPENVIYSFTLYERAGRANLLRVQTDNYDGLLNINEGVKLELGSTAKLRALVTYLEIIAGLHRAYASLSAEELRGVEVERSDRLTRWTVDYLLSASDRGLERMLEAAMDRRYSASPGESFFTGGGRHTFQNFNREDDGRVVSVLEAFDNSVNLPFVRLMRDVVHHYMFRVPGSSARILEDTKDPGRQLYLARFADREGLHFLNRFYRKYAGREPDEILALLVEDLRPTPRRLATVFRSVRPEAPAEELVAFLRARLPGSVLSERGVEELWAASDPEKVELADRGYIARVHPLELWVAAYLTRHPGASRRELAEASAAERQEVYRWLFTTRRKGAQDVRIRSLLEVEAFLEIHRDWRRQGYPFGFLVPSYASAIGSSADRPAALAELVGIVLNDGVRYPTVRVRRMDFASDTPYATVLRREEPSSGERVLEPEVAGVLRRALAGVVERGTARRVHRAFVTSDGTPLVLGGKTGTGDNRHEIYGARGRLIEQRAVNRTATFVFYIGDRFFGTITAYVPGPDSAQYGFTSSLPVQLLKHLAPALMPLLERPPGVSGTATETPVPSSGDSSAPLEFR